MSGNDDALSASIEDYLLSLGHSLHTAQRQLAGMSTTVVPGDAPVTYHIPRLDFEFKVSFELSQSGGAAEAGRLAVRPVQGATGSSSSVEAASVIKGSFVAVPLRGGKPPPILTTSIHRLPGRAISIQAELRTAAGEALSGTEVHFNLDSDASRLLCQAENKELLLAPLTGFQQGKTRTDANGQAVNLFYVDPSQKGGLPLMLLVEASGVAEKLLYTLPEAPATTITFGGGGTGGSGTGGTNPARPDSKQPPAAPRAGAEPVNPAPTRRPRRLWYADRDGDGFGDRRVTVVAEEAPPGFVADNTDIDDANADLRGEPVADAEIPASPEPPPVEEPLP